MRRTGLKFAVDAGLTDGRLRVNASQHSRVGVKEAFAASAALRVRLLETFVLTLKQYLV